MFESTIFLKNLQYVRIRSAMINLDEWSALALNRALMAACADKDVVLLENPCLYMTDDEERAFYAFMQSISFAGKLVIVSSPRSPDMRLIDRLIIMEEGYVKEERLRGTDHRRIVT